MVWRIEIYNKAGMVDAVGDGIRSDIADLGISGVERVCFIRLYELTGELTAEDVDRIAAQLLVDPVTQTYRCGQAVRIPLQPGQWGIEVRFRPGVTDAVGETTLKGIKDLGIQNITAASTGRAYVVEGRVAEQDIATVCRRLLANEIIEECRYYTV